MINVHVQYLHDLGEVPIGDVKFANFTTTLIAIPTIGSTVGLPLFTGDYLYLEVRDVVYLDRHDFIVLHAVLLPAVDQNYLSDLEMAVLLLESGWYLDATWWAALPKDTRDRFDPPPPPKPLAKVIPFRRR